MNKKNILIIVIAIIIIALVYFFIPQKSEEKMNFKIPNIFAQYMSAQDWEIKVNEFPADIKIENGEIICEETPLESSVNSGTFKKVINGRAYCMKMSAEGAAGSVYTTYDYYTIDNNNLISISVTVRATQCYNYDEPKTTECTTERETFNIDNFIGDIIQ